jgi:hypothetical protein
MRQWARWWLIPWSEMIVTKIRILSLWTLLLTACGGGKSPPVVVAPLRSPIVVLLPKPSTPDAGAIVLAADADRIITYASLEDACAQLVGAEPPADCTPNILTIGGKPEHTAPLLRMSAWEKTFALLAVTAC